jgi:hypothetical protein
MLKMWSGFSFHKTQSALLQCAISVCLFRNLFIDLFI